LQKVFDFAIDIMISFVSLVHFMPSKLQCYNFYPDLAFFCKFMVENKS